MPAPWRTPVAAGAGGRLPRASTCTGTSTLVVTACASGPPAILCSAIASGLWIMSSRPVDASALAADNRPPTVLPAGR